MQSTTIELSAENMNIPELFSALAPVAPRILLESREINTGLAKQSRGMLSAALKLVCKGQRVSVTGQYANLKNRLAAALQAKTPGLQTTIDETNGQYLFEFPSAPATLTEDERLRYPNPLDVLRETLGLEEGLVIYGGFAFEFIDTYETLPQPAPAAPGEDFPDYEFYLTATEFLYDPEPGELTVRSYFAPDSQQTDLLTTHTKLVEAAAGYVAANYVRQTLERSGLTNATTDAPSAGSSLTSLTSFTSFTPSESHQTSKNVELWARPTISTREFESKVLQLQENIAAGDIYQVVPSRGFRLPVRVPAFDVYRRLRESNPSPYLFYFDLGWTELVGSSPESSLRVNGQTRRIAMRPIAGTQPRALLADGEIDAEEDIRAQVRLRTDRKETAEHLMLVDLARNDLARICTSGTRQVSKLLTVEKYSRVMHLVSQVEGVLSPDFDALDAYRACMNMGTLTGAPKLRAVELLREAEGTRRGIYGGAVGYMNSDGDFDTAIAIRCAQITDGQALVRAGAGVVRDSRPQAEAAETFHKARAVLEAISAVQGATLAGIDES